MIAIPALDLIKGEAVRLFKGDYEKKTVYSDDPVSLAKRFSDAGIKRLHVVDLLAAKGNGENSLDILERIVSAANLSVDYAGGIRSIPDAERAFERGASYVSISSMAVKDKKSTARLIEKYGDKIILFLDCLDSTVRISGWLEDSKLSYESLLDFYIPIGLEYVALTDISKDGTLSGPSLDLYKRVLEKYPVRVIASGGIRDKKDLESLDRISLDSAIVGRAYYEKRISLEEMAHYAS